MDGLNGERIGRLAQVDAAERRLLLGVQIGRGGGILENRQVVENLLLLGSLVLLFRFVVGPGFFSHSSLHIRTTRFAHG
jgi:hypothetical protein